MSRFNRLLDATFTPPRRWVLNTALSFDGDWLNEEEIAQLKSIGVRINTKGKVTVSKGFDTDLASVPRFAWAFIAPFDIARAAVIHDYLYSKIRDYRADCAQSDVAEDIELIKDCKVAADTMFLEGMKVSEPKVAPWKIWAAHRSVVMFGNGSIVPR